MKVLNGAELRDFIKERQAKQVRALRQSWKVFPKLVIFYAGNSQVVKTYINLKKQYGEDILVDVEIRQVEIEQIKNEITAANKDESVHGIIVQLPLQNAEGNNIESEELLEMLATITPEKDVDGLSSETFDSATAIAINWLLAGYNIDLINKKIAIVGQGLLVGKPLAKMWKKSGLNISTFDINNSTDLQTKLVDYDVVVSAVGVPGLIKSNMLKNKAVVVDAGTASEDGVIKGDVDANVRDIRKDLAITPVRGGVGPLTVAALIDNVIIAARKIADRKGQQDLN